MTTAFALSRSPLFVLIVLVLTLAACGTTTTPHDFQLDAGTVSSIAAEGALMADDVGPGGTTNAFTKVHAGELATTAEQLRFTLLANTPQGGVHARALAAIAHQVSLRVAVVATRPPQREAQRLRRELQRLAAAAGRMAEQG